MSNTLIAVLVASAMAASMTGAEAACEGAFWTQYAYDYRNPKSLPYIKDIEKNHFNAQVEALKKPLWGHFGSDIQYLLERVPNHPRALSSFARLVEREGVDQPTGASVPIECQFQRAFLFARDDPLPRLVYADHLVRRKMRADALRQLEYIVQQAGDNGITHFKAGLIYSDMQCYGLALRQAHRALALGMKNPLLQQRLVEAKQWRDATEEELAAWADGRDPAPNAEAEVNPECRINMGAP